MNDTRVWCWRCGEQRDRTTSYVHRADNPVLAHERCGVCHDPLMPYPQPTLPEKLAELGAHLHDAYRWSRTVTTEAPSSADEAALHEISELLAAARRVYFQQLDPDLRAGAAR
ncbi:hypothetical protein [Nocardia wallacei]|uniref:hypothetical protein n=1 Tax=Nocardia wallacei TaxID=480035 RepID=UPI002454AB79|nr:hypothetical protein [Nocardia wallacei]